MAIRRFAIQQVTLQRELAQQGLTSTNESAQIAQYAGGGSGGSETLSVTLPRATANALRRAAANRRAIASTSACSDYETVTTTVVSATVENLTIQLFYDSDCVTLEAVAQFTLTVNSSTSAIATGSYTYFTESGVVYEYDNPVTISFGISPGPEYVSYGGDVATSTSAAPFEAVGVGCSIGTASSTCAIAGVQHLSAFGIDQGEAASATASLASGNTTVVSIGGNGSGYNSGLDVLNVAAQGTAGWIVTGASPTISVLLSGSVSYGSNGALVGESLAVADSTDGASIALSYTAASEDVTGTITQTATGSIAATFSISASTGSGTISYGNGTTGTITDWVVVS